MLIQRYITKIMHDKANRRKLRYIFYILSLIVVCCVSWQLRLNAITMSGTPVCGNETHTHTRACYTSQNDPGGQDGEIMLLSDTEDDQDDASGQIENVKQVETAAQAEPVSQPEMPAQTEVVSQPETPAQTEAASQPETPAQTEAASQPETPAQTEAASQPEMPAQTEAASQPETPAQTEAASQPETPAQTEAVTEGRQTETVSTEAVTEGRQTETVSTEAMTEGRQTETISTEAANISLKASFTEYTVHYFDFDFGKPDRGILKTETVSADKTATAPELTAVPSGYKWDGKWYTDSACTKIYDFSLSVGAYAQQAGLSGNDIMLYPGMSKVYNVIFITNKADEGIPPLSVESGTIVDLDQTDYTPSKTYYIFDGWYADEALTKPVSGAQTITADTTFYAKWLPGMTTFKPVRRLEAINEDKFTVEKRINTEEDPWYAKVGSTIYVESTYDETDSSKNKHAVMWKLGEETGAVVDDNGNPVYLDDVYEDYYLYNNENKAWSDAYGMEEVDGNQVSTGQLPYSDKVVIRDQGITKVYFDYMRARVRLVFKMSNKAIDTSDVNDGGYLDFYTLNQNGLLKGTVTVEDHGIGAGNHYAYGKTPSGLSWAYSPGSAVDDNLYTINNVKVGYKNIDAYTSAKGVTLTDGKYADMYSAANWKFIEDPKRVPQLAIEDLPTELVTGKGRNIKEIELRLYRMQNEKRLAVYLLQTLPGEAPDCTIEGIDYTLSSTVLFVQTSLIAIKDRAGCENGFYVGTGYKSLLNRELGYSIENGKLVVKNVLDENNIGLGNPTKDAYTLISLEKAQSFAEAAATEQEVNLAEVNAVFIIAYPRVKYNLIFDLNYPSNAEIGNRANQVNYSDILYGTPLKKYQNGGPDIGSLLECPGYEFVGWATDSVLDQEAAMTDADWDQYTMPEQDTTLFALWKKTDYLIEFYADRPENWKDGKDYLVSSSWMENGETAKALGTIDWSQYSSYVDDWTSSGPLKWIWQDADSTSSVQAYKDFVFGDEYYAKSGTKEKREVNGVEKEVYVIKVYALWHDSDQERTSLTVLKNWSDGESLHQNDSITVHLYMDGAQVDDAQYPDVTTTLTLDSSNGWTAVFDNLPYYSKQTYLPIQYTVVEDEVAGYYAQYGEAEKITSSSGSIPTYRIEITNQAGYRLPETGGEGTLVYWLLGILLMSIPAAYSWKQKENKLKN